MCWEGGGKQRMLKTDLGCILVGWEMARLHSLGGGRREGLLKSVRCCRRDVMVSDHQAVAARVGLLADAAFT